VRIRGLDPVSRTAQTITGRVTFTPCEIMFQNGKSLMLDRGGQMPEAKKAKVMADLYKVTSLDDPVLANGKKLCKGKTRHLPDCAEVRQRRERGQPSSLASFSAQKFDAGSPDDCGRFHLRRRSALNPLLTPEYYLTCLWSAVAIL
jgi:hypothetical protein